MQQERRMNVFAVWEALLSWLEAVASVNWLLMAYHHPSRKGTMLKLTTAQFVKGLGPANKRLTRRWV